MVFNGGGTMLKSSLLCAAGLVAGVFAATAAVAAQSAGPGNFPNKSLRIVVPFPAGGTTDVVARLVALRMTESMGQTVLVDNRGGAGGTIGADIVAKAAPDGYTLLMHNITFPLSSVAQALAKRLPFNADTDFAGVSIAVYVPFVITSHPSVPAKDLRELGNLLRGNTKLQYNYGSTGPGSVMHVIGETFKRDAKVDMVHVAFKGAAPLKQDVLSGRVQIGGDQLSSSLAEIRAGTLKVLATNASKRLAVLPDVPTVRELGFPSLEFEGWNGLFVPAKTPQPIIERLHKEVVAAIRHPDVVKRLTDLAAEPIGSSPKEQEAVLRRQMDQFRPVIREMKLD
jgi:tripartite-type tricarboxylate transporter receptor subunit TctC